MDKNNLMKKTSLFIYFACISAFLHCQTDTLETINGNKVSVIITEITPNEIIYKIPSKPNAPLFHFARIDLKGIVLKDGSSVNPIYDKSANPLDKSETLKKRSIIYFTPSKLVLNQIGFAYEYVFKSNLVGIRIPASVAFIDAAKANLQGSTLHRTDNKRYFSTGIDVNFYPFKLGNFKYVTGFGLQYAQFAYQPYYGYSYPPIYSANKIGNHYSFIINNGFFSQLGKHFVMNCTVGMGLQFETTNYYNGQITPRINATFNVGYLF